MKQQMLFEQFPDPDIHHHMSRQLPAEQRNTAVELLAELMGRIVNSGRGTPPPDRGISPEGLDDE